MLKQYIRIPLLLVSLLFLSGCILLPIPHEQWLSPQFTGVITDADTGVPLARVKITLSGYRYAEEEVGAIVVYSDEQGKFAVRASKRTNWLPIWFGPAEGNQGGAVLFQREGYASVEEKRNIFTGASNRTAFELTVSMKKVPDEQLR